MLPQTFGAGWRSPDGLKSNHYMTESCGSMGATCSDYDEGCQAKPITYTVRYVGALIVDSTALACRVVNILAPTGNFDGRLPPP